MEVKYRGLLEHHELLAEASKEAIEFTLLDLDMQGISFLHCWNNGEWSTIKEEWPEFNINSIAQQYLISESGGM